MSYLDLPLFAERRKCLVRLQLTNCCQEMWLDNSLDHWLLKEGSGEKNFVRKRFKCWNAAVGVDGGKNTTSANQRSSSTNDRK